LIEHNQGQAHWHADETRWLVYASVEGKVGHRWTLWVFQPARQKVLSSLQEHRDGLTVFVEHPEVPLDNNRAERVLPGPVVGRKNYRGSGAGWSGELAAMLFSVFQTLCLWKVKPRVGLEAYLRECARAGGEAPADVGEYLPWKTTEQKRKEWSLEKEQERDDRS
jgi:Transposase IS66 family